MIPFFDLKPEYRKRKREINRAIQRVLTKQKFILGEETERFEKEFAAYIGVRYAVGINSGSDALYLALKAAGVTNHDEVITTSFTFISTADAIVRRGATPVFVDIDPRTYTFDVHNIEKRITKKTKAILPVHLYGHPVDMGPLLALARSYGLYVVEDACQAHGAFYRGKRVGSLSDIAAFSFYPSKNLGAYGDGGMVVTNNRGLAREVRLLRNYGEIRKYHYVTIGLNSRLDELQAAVLRVKLRYLDQNIEERRKLAERYTGLLRESPLRLPLEQDYARHGYYLYVIAHKKRSALAHHLKKKGISTQIHYPVPVHLQKSYNILGYRKGSLPITERLAGEVLSLPFYPGLRKRDMVRVSNEIFSFFAKESY